MEDVNTASFITAFNTAMRKGETIVFLSTCEITYEGRAESHLPLGDRIILIKPDRTLIIHQPTGSAPVNYMKAGSEHELVREEGFGDDKGMSSGQSTSHGQSMSPGQGMNQGPLIMKSRHHALKEYLELKIVKLHFYNTAKLEDDKKIELAGTEKDLSDHLYEHPELIEEGFKPLSREEHTKYGFIDVFGYDRTGTLVVVECKRYRADLSAVTQLRRYVEKIKAAKGVPRVRGILAAPEISANALKMLTDWGYSFRDVHPPKKLKVAVGQKKIGEY
jgi:RecB family endonuclease NucS